MRSSLISRLLYSLPFDAEKLMTRVAMQNRVGCTHASSCFVFLPVSKFTNIGVYFIPFFFKFAGLKCVLRTINLANV